MGLQRADSGEAPTLRELRAFLGDHPKAMGLAIGSHGLEWHALPSEISDTLRPYKSRSAPETSPETSLEMVIDNDRTIVIGAFARCWQHGYAECMATPIGESEPMALLFWDLRTEMDLILVVIIPDLVVESEDADPSSLKPRLLHHTVNEGGQTLTCDRGTEVLLGWTEADLLSESRLRFIHPDDHESSIAHWVEMLAKPGASSRCQLRYKHKTEDRWLWFETTQTNLLRSEGYVEVELFDISDEKAAQDALQERERLLARLTEAMPTGVLHVGPELEVLFVNERFAEISGLETNDSRRYLDLLSQADLDRVLDAFAHASDGVDSDLEMGFIRVDGQHRRCRMQVRSLGDRQSGVLMCVDDITESSKLQEQLEYQATTDALTGVANRLSVLATLEHAQKEAALKGHVNAVVFLDLDGFKQVNDRHGHAVGDHLLVATAKALGEAVRPTDIVGRLGGDEFLVVCPNVGDEAAAEEISRRLEDASRRTLHLAGEFVETTASCGLAVDRGGVRTAEELVAQADSAMYAQKNVRTHIRTLWANLGVSASEELSS